MIRKTSVKIAMSALTILMLMQLLGVVVFGDYNDGFDLYPAGTANPGPWAVSVTSTSCFTAHSVSSSVGNPLTTPNLYAFKVAGSSNCVGTSAYANATMSFNASQSFTTLKGFVRFFGNGSDLTPSTINGNVCFSNVHGIPCHLSGGGGGSVDLSTCTVVVSNYCQVTVSAATTAGTTYYFGFEVYFAATWSQSCSTCFAIWDNMTIIGGNAINYPRNFVMLNQTTNQWFNIVGYGGPASRVIVNYSSGTSTTTFPVTAPDLQLNLASATLITSWVGNSYFRTIIPAASGNTTMQMSLPTQVSPYIVQVIDPYGTVRPGSVIAISTGGLVTTSGYVDSTLQFSTYLTPGIYSILLKNVGGTIVFNGLETFQPPANIGATTPVQVTVTNDTVTKQNGIFTDIRQGIAVSSGNILATFNDTQTHTTMVNMTLENSNTSGTFNLGTVCFSTSPHSGCSTVGSIGVRTASFTFNNNLQQQYIVFYTFVSSKYGTNTIGPYPVVGGGFFASTPSPQNNCVLGFCALLTTSYANTYDVFLNLIAVVIVVFLASSFGAKYASIGAFVVNIFTAIFALGGWIPLLSVFGTPLLTVLILVAAISYMKSREAREIIT